MMGTETVFETSALYRHLTQWISREEFIEVHFLLWKSGKTQCSAAINRLCPGSKLLNSKKIAQVPKICTVLELFIPLMYKFCLKQFSVLVCI